MFTIEQLEAVGWALLLAAAMAMVVGTFREAQRRGEASWLFAVVGVALVVRLIIPWLPPHWYFAGGNILHSVGIFDHPIARAPWIDRLVGFYLGWADVGLGWTHLFGSLAGIVLIWASLQWSGLSLAVRTATCTLFAITPMYARFSVTDASHLWPWICFAASAGALGVNIHGSKRSIAGVVVVVLAPLLGAPIRLESAPLLFAALLWVIVARPVPLREVLRLPLVIAFLSTCLVGLGVAVLAHRGDFASRFRFDFGNVLFGLLFRVVLQLPSWPWPPAASNFPLVLTLLYWVLLLRRVKDRDRLQLAWMAASSLYCAGPFLFGQMLFSELGGAGYSLVACSLLVLWAAQGGVVLWEQWSPTPGRHRWLVIAACSLGAASFVPPWFRTYSFMEETRFLRRAIAHRHGVIVAVADPQGSRCSHDADATVGLPDAVLAVREPGLRWIVFNGDSAGSVDPHSLMFDYYYRGGDLELDPASMDGWFQRLVNGDARSRRCHAERLARLHRLDDQIRAIFPLRVVEQEAVTARTYSFIAFPEDRETLTLYARAP